MTEHEQRLDELNRDLKLWVIETEVNWPWTERERTSEDHN